MLPFFGDNLEATFDFVAKNGSQCRTSFALKFHLFDKVECCFDKVERCFDIVAGVDRALVECSLTGDGLGGSRGVVDASNTDAGRPVANPTSRVLTTALRRRVCGASVTGRQSSRGRLRRRRRRVLVLLAEQQPVLRRHLVKDSDEAGTTPRSGEPGLQRSTDPGGRPR